MYEYYDLGDRNMRGTLRDWRKALRTPTSYRVGHTVRLQPQILLLISIIGAFIIILFYYNWTSNNVIHVQKFTNLMRPYNSTYPLSSPLVSGDLVTYRIGIVADLDTNSKNKVHPYLFHSYFKKGYLSYHLKTRSAVVSWDKPAPVQLTSTYSFKGRGMELSELFVFDGRLLTFDDRSGMIFEILNDRMIPWVVLTDGNGQVEKGFKAEWATVKDEHLYVGSMGKEWTTSSGEFVSYDPMWIKMINMYGEVQHLSWVNQFKAIRSSIGISYPGYMIHESGVWSTVNNKWYFLPRRCSHEKYNETKDEMMGCNYLITSDPVFGKVEAIKITKLQPKHGFSSFKFIPGTKDQAIVALKTTEFEGKTATYIEAFTTDGTVLMQETFIENLKYEGLEFI